MRRAGYRDGGIQATAFFAAARAGVHELLAFGLIDRPRFNRVKLETSFVTSARRASMFVGWDHCPVRIKHGSVGTMVPTYFGCGYAALGSTVNEIS